MEQSTYGQGTWDASIRDRITGSELELPRDVWSGECERVEGVPSEAEIVIDPSYLSHLGREPRPWDDELIYYRDDQEWWGGPFVLNEDISATDGLWTANDRMRIVLDRRAWWRTMNLQASGVELFETALVSAEFGDPLGLRFDPRPAGIRSSLRTVTGDQISGSIIQLNLAGVGWTMINDIIRFGDLSIDTGRLLTNESWGDNRPKYENDGLAKLTHVVAITASEGRAYYPSLDPTDRPEGSTLLVESVFVGDITAAQALNAARKIYERRQGGVFVDLEQEIQLSSSFPIPPEWLIPGALMDASLGAKTLAPVNLQLRVARAKFMMAQGRELSVSATLAEAPVSARPAATIEVGGVEIPALLTGTLADAIPEPADRAGYVPNVPVPEPSPGPFLPPLPWDFEQQADTETPDGDTIDPEPAPEFDPGDQIIYFRGDPAESEVEGQDLSGLGVVGFGNGAVISEVWFSTLQEEVGTLNIDLNYKQPSEAFTESSSFVFTFDDGWERHATAISVEYGTTIRIEVNGGGTGDSNLISDISVWVRIEQA